MRNYTKGFDYDIVGNLLETKHQAGDTSWKRLYEYESPSTLDSNDMDNRLTKTTVGSDDVVYDYDVHGNMTETAHLSKMEWGFQDQLFATAKQEISNGDPETTYYVYDAGGQRVRKVTEREDSNGSGDPNRKNERIYLGDFEIYREYENDDQEPVETERKTLHVSDDHSRIALIETKTVDDSQNVSDPEPLVRHQLGDHLNSASLELDETGSIISYEEYYPYGSTSYQSVDGDTEVSAKRYRYTGKERDEETGFYYHGARYYAPWLCRWTAPDPAGMVDGVNLYEYVKGNPVRLRDPDGMEAGEGENWVDSNIVVQDTETTEDVLERELGPRGEAWTLHSIDDEEEQTQLQSFVDEHVIGGEESPFEILKINRDYSESRGEPSWEYVTYISTQNERTLLVHGSRLDLGLSGAEILSSGRTDLRREIMPHRLDDPVMEILLGHPDVQQNAEERDLTPEEFLGSNEFASPLEEYSYMFFAANQRGGREHETVGHEMVHLVLGFSGIAMGHVAWGAPINRPSEKPPAFEALEDPELFREMYYAAGGSVENLIDSLNQVRLSTGYSAFSRMTAEGIADKVVLHGIREHGGLLPLNY